jgi:probable F420-dependent oxidoreductase
VQIGLLIPNTGPGATEQVARFGPAAEAWGYDSVWVTDHVVGAGYGDLYGPIWAEVVTSLAYLAGVTSRVRLGTSILVVPYRHPVVLAKMLATVDRVSGGRLDVGVGTGWSEREYRALGVGDLYGGRGAVLDEALDVMLACWKGGRVAADGPFFVVPEIEFDPVPAQTPHPPLWVACLEGRTTEAIGARVSRSMRRVARIGDGWHPAWMAPERVVELGARLDDLAGRRIRRNVRVTIAPEEADRAEAILGAYRDAGCDVAVVEIRPADADMTWRVADALASRFAASGWPR